MKRYSRFLLIAGIFVAGSGLIYLPHYFIFRDTHHINIYMLGDLAFLPLEVFLVVIVIERILARREKQAIIQKLNMVVVAFSARWVAIYSAVCSVLSGAVGKSASILASVVTGRQMILKRRWLFPEPCRLISITIKLTLTA